MRLYEFIDSDEQLLSIIKPILLRAKAEGVTSVSLRQLSNDIEDDSVTPELLVSILNKHRNKLKDIISSANYDEIVLNNGHIKTMTTKYDQDVKKMKNTAIKQAMDKLK